MIMQIHLRKMDILLVGLASLLLLILGIIGWFVLDSQVLILSLSIVLFLILFFQIELYRRRSSFYKEQALFYQKQASFYQTQEQNYKQIESLMYMLSVIKLRRPLPLMRNWSVSPDHMNIIISTIMNQKPKIILECGSGVSTLLMSYCVENLKQGYIWALDHDKKYANISKENLTSHQLENVATIIHAPLKEIHIHGKSWLWYDTKQLQNIEPIDLLVIDGPPGKTQRMARYPALPQLINSLNDNAIIILDDGAREDEKNIVKAWLKEFKNFRYEWYDTEKGTVILKMGV